MLTLDLILKKFSINLKPQNPTQFQSVLDNFAKLQIPRAFEFAKITNILFKYQLLCDMQL